jgi:hypothetical protein
MLGGEAENDKRTLIDLSPAARLLTSSPLGDYVAIPFMVREPHHERDCLIVN